MSGHVKKNQDQMTFDFGLSNDTPEDVSLVEEMLTETGEVLEVVDLDAEWAEPVSSGGMEKSLAEEEEDSVPPTASPAEPREEGKGEPEKTSGTVPVKKQDLTPQNLKRAALAFLAALNPTGMALTVPTRLKKFQADAAAFWSAPNRKGLLKIQKTAIVQTSFENIVSMDCSNRRELTAYLAAAKLERANLEAEIRRTEPHLKDMDTLFSDFEAWNYNRSANRAYKECLKRIDELEYALYHGSRLEKMRRAKTASQLYLAVPENTVAPDEIADSWGLIYVMPDLSFRLVKEPETWNCPEENLYHLAQNISASALRDVRFANGIVADSDGVRLGPLPRRRRIYR